MVAYNTTAARSNTVTVMRRHTRRNLKDSQGKSGMVTNVIFAP